MSIPGFTAEASIGKHGRYYQRPSPIESDGAALGVLPAQGRLPAPWPPMAPSPWPGFGNWFEYEVPGQEVLCDTRCLRECQAALRKTCGGDALCVVELQPVCRERCCPGLVAPSFGV